MGRKKKGTVDNCPPSHPNGWSKLLAAFFAKHESLGERSPLCQLADDFDWDRTKASCLKYEDEEKKRADYASKSQQARENRDKFRQQFEPAVTAAKNLLKGYYPNNPKALEDWGFKVVLDMAENNITEKPSQAASAAKSA